MTEWPIDSQRKTKELGLGLAPHNGVQFMFKDSKKYANGASSLAIRQLASPNNGAKETHRNTDTVARAPGS
jgi:hypothetical protein